MRNLVVDCEIIGDPQIHGWRNFEKLGISVAVVLDVDTAEEYVFTAHPHDGTYKLSELPQLLDGQHIIGHNVIRFDIPLIRTVAGNFTPGKITDFWDALYKETGRMIALQHIVMLNGIGSKTMHGAEAPRAWAEGRYRDVIEYCRNDVKLEAQVYRRVISGEGVVVCIDEWRALYCKLVIINGELGVVWLD